MSWKTYFNALMKSKVKLFGEKLWFFIMVKRFIQLGGNIYQDNTKVKCIYNQSSKKMNVWGKLREQ